ncbi:MAG: tripartite tricarboxylate transporter substrate binding protein [Gammaproteobacteria bacterium]
MKKYRHLSLWGLASLLLVSLATTLTPGIAQAWQPQHPVNLIIMAGKGGGADKLARLWQSIVAKHKLSPQPLIPINKGGGSGAEALRYMEDNKGSRYDIVVTLDSLYTTPIIIKGLNVDPTTFTPIRLMAQDTFLLWVTDPKIKTIDDYVKAVNAAGGKWKMGGTGSGQEDSLVTAMLADAYNLHMIYVPYKGGGTVAAQLIGGHINSTVNNPSEQLGFYQAGKSHPIAQFTDTRLPGFPNVPTFKELGKPSLVYYMDRMVLGPPGMPKDAQEFYMKLFQKISETKEWKNYVSKNSLLASDLQGDSMHSYLVKRYKLHEKLVPLWQKFNK